MNDPLTRAIYYVRDWTYDNYHWAYLAGTAVLCNGIFYPNPAHTIYAWLVCVVLGAVLEPCVNPYRQVYGQSLGQLRSGVALTFDDGPSEDTPALLDLLKQEGVKATFFVIGNQIDKHPDILRRIADEGHLIGNHTSTHPNLMLSTPAQTRAELERVQRQIQQLTGQKPTWWRPPFGFRSPWTQPVATRLGLKCALWTLNPRDFQDPGAEVIFQRVMSNLKEGAIVLLHDGLEKRGQTLEATRQLIGRIKEQGMRMVTLDDA